VTTKKDVAVVLGPHYEVLTAGSEMRYRVMKKQHKQEVSPGFARLEFRIAGRKSACIREANWTKVLRGIFRN
jgi:hypothetical protein